MRRSPPGDFEQRRERTSYLRKRGRPGAPRRTPWKPASSGDSAQELSKILGKFREFQVNGQFCDGVITSADGKVYEVHRVLLASNSDYFRAAFCSPLSKNESVVHLEFPSSVVDVIVDFCYTHSCNLKSQNVQQILPAADKLGVIGLVELCCKMLSENLTLSNVYGVFRFASVYGCETLARKAFNMILYKFSTFFDESPEFPEMIVDDLVLLLSNSSLNCSETTVFRALSEWINVSPTEREKYARQLWECVRFGLITPKFYRTEVLTASFLKRISSSNLWNAIFAIKKDGAPPELTTPRTPYQVVFAIGGWSVGAPTNCMESYDMRADKWFKLDLNDVVPRAYHGLVSVDNLLYMIGGFDGTNHFNSVRCFDPATKQWSEKACMHKPRCYVPCVVVNKDIYAIGGFNSTTRMSSVEKYSVVDNQWTFAPPMNQRRSDCGAVVVGNKIYVVGGFNGQEVLETAEYYNIDTETWHLLPNLNIRRSGVCLVHYRNYIYAIGGFSGGMRLNTVERLSTLRPNQWHTDVPSMITQRSNFCSVVLEDKIYVMGGFNGLSTVRYCECFDGEKWFEITGMNQSRSALSVCVCEGLTNVGEFTNACLGTSSNSKSQATQVREFMT